MFGRPTLQAHPQDEKGSFMRSLVALIAVFIVSGHAVADKTEFHVDWGDGDVTFKCQLKGKGPSGPVYACKDPKTGKTQKVECQLSGNNNGDIHAQKMPKQLSGAELQQLCFEDR